MSLFTYIKQHQAASLTIVLALTVAVLFAARRITGDVPADFSRRTTVFNTFAEIKIWDAPSLADADQAAEAVFEYLYELHDIVNAYDPESELSQLNRKAYEEPFQCSPALWNLLIVAEDYHERTDGLFDITVGSLIKLWGFNGERDSWPTEEEIEQALAPVGFDKVVLDKERRSVQFTHPDTAIDLGGLVKGYALDEIEAILNQKGINVGMINIGGDIVALESSEKAEGYRIGVRHPRQPRSLLTTLTVENRGVATSGNYENFRQIDDRTVSHIVNPKTGLPATEVLSATVIAETATAAEVYATALSIGGTEMARKFVEEKPHYRRVILVLADPDDPDEEILVEEFPAPQE